ncbi:MAG: lysophospholipid acyltransferase family protein, partial [Bacteroidia bacterium]
MKENKKPLIPSSPNTFPRFTFRSAFRLLINPLQNLFTGKSQLNRFYQSLEEEKNPAKFAEKALQKLGISVNFEAHQADIEALKKVEGPLILMSNHPFGGVEALMMICLMNKIREDYRFLANSLLQSVDELNEVLLPIESKEEKRQSHFWYYMNPFQIREEKIDNEQNSSVKSIIQLRKYLENGGLLGIFPTGEEYETPSKRRHFVTYDWEKWMSKLILNSKATVVPVYFHGSNSWIFHLMRLLSPTLRKKMSPLSFMSDRNKALEFRIGKKITYNRLAEFEKESEDETDYLKSVTKFLQGRLYLLSLHFTQVAGINVAQMLQPQLFGIKNSKYEIIKAIGKDMLLKEITELPKDALLLENEQYCVYRFLKSQAPWLMREVGRLREETFRAVGEGSGKDCDMDEFDEYYTQLVLWDKQKQAVAGGYRIGKTDEILATRGIEGIYICTIFNVKAELLTQVQPAIELGRSFVAQEYQRSFQPLMLLWTGICQFILKGNLKYHYIIGPVSISAEMNVTSKTLLVNFLEQNELAEGLTDLVKAKKPFEGTNQARKYYQSFSTDDMRDLQEAIVELENEQMGIPVLFKHYLKMGAKMLAFNIDEDFSDVLDCFMMTNLLETDRHLLSKYMTKEGLKTYLEYH